MIHVSVKVRDFKCREPPDAKRNEYIDIVQSEAFNELSFSDLSSKNVDPFALPAVYGDARILAGGC
jgi:hypothetical protein